MCGYLKFNKEQIVKLLCRSSIVRKFILVTVAKFSEVKINKFGGTQTHNWLIEKIMDGV